MNTITIQNRIVGAGQPCFIVAELSGNHRQKEEEAVKLVKAAKEAGADAVKLQTYTPDTITLNSNREWFVVGSEGDRPESWQNQTLYDLYKMAYTPWEWQPKLKKLADELDIILFSSPFDETAVDFLENMGVPCYKVASYEAVHIPLLKKIASKGKPVIMSIGYASLQEAEFAVQTLKQGGVAGVAVLHCVTSYADTPKVEYMNLRTIADIAGRFGVPAGFSDNNAGIQVPVVAVAAGGAKVLEKHFILDRSFGGPDARFSIEPTEFKRMVDLIRRAEAGDKEGVLREIGIGDVEQAMGRVHYGPASPQEGENIRFRPGVWAKRDIRKGEHLTKDNIRVARPAGPAGTFMPKDFEKILGKKAAQGIEPATPLSWDLIETREKSARMNRNDPQDIIASFLGEKAAKLFELLSTQAPHKADVIVFLQGDQLDRAPKAQELYEKGFAKPILISGNNILIGKGKRLQEDDFALPKLKQYLLDHGVPSHAILIDEQAMNTLQQARNTIKLAKERKWSRMLVVASPYHVLRAYLAFVSQARKQRWEGKITMQTADLSWESVPSGREKTAREMLGEEMEKIKQYQADLNALEKIF